MVKTVPSVGYQLVPPRRGTSAAGLGTTTITTATKEKERQL